MDDNIRGDNLTPRADSSDTIAMILEIVFGFFGIFGIGWLYAGNLPVAIAVFVGFLIIAVIEVFVITVTFGIAACFTVPFNLAVAIVSGLRARDYMRNTGKRGSLLYVVLAVVVGAAVICGSIIFLGTVAGVLGSL